MQKMSNSTSPLIQQMLKAAAAAKPKEQEQTLRLADILKAPKPERKLTLREILAQAMGEPPADPAGAAPPPPPPPAGGEAPLGEETDPGAGACPPDVVQKLVDALIAACGDAEAAKAKIDELGGGAGGEALPDAAGGADPLGAAGGPVDSVEKGGEGAGAPPPPAPPAA